MELLVLIKLTGSQHGRDHAEFIQLGKMVGRDFAVCLSGMMGVFGEPGHGVRGEVVGRGVRQVEGSQLHVRVLLFLDVVSSVMFVPSGQHQGNTQGDDQDGSHQQNYND